MLHVVRCPASSDTALDGSSLKRVSVRGRIRDQKLTQKQDTRPPRSCVPVAAYLFPLYSVSSSSSCCRSKVADPHLVSVVQWLGPCPTSCRCRLDSLAPHEAIVHISRFHPNSRCSDRTHRPFYRVGGYLEYFEVVKCGEVAGQGVNPIVREREYLEARQLTRFSRERSELIL